MKFLANTKGLTLVELLVSVTLSGIMFIIVFVFTQTGINTVNNNLETSTINNSLFNINETLSSKSVEGFNTYAVVNDVNLGEGNDVVLLLNDEQTEGYMFGLVNLETLRLEQDSNYANYGKKVLGYRYLSETEINDIESDSSVIYNYSFFSDKVFEGMIIKDLQIDLYNSGDIINFYFNALIHDKLDYNGVEWEDIPKSDFIIFNLNY